MEAAETLDRFGLPDWADGGSGGDEEPRDISNGQIQRICSGFVDMMTAEAQQVFRDEWLGGHQMSTTDEVRRASAQFYAALNQMAEGDASSMSEIWVDGADATALHPIGGRDEGSEQLLAAFAQVASIASGGQIRLTDQLIQVGGDLAYEVGIEEGEVTLAGEQITIDHRVTNIYRYEDGEWKMIHHHTDASPAMQELLKRLQQSE